MARRVNHQLPCPCCGYDLRGQTIERCPECGNEYDAEEIRHELHWRWESALAPFHIALPLLAGTALVIASLLFVPDRIWWRSGLLLALFAWLLGKVVTHLLRGAVMGDVLGEFQTGAGGSLLAWCIDIAGTFPYWTDVIFVAAMLARYLSRDYSLLMACLMAVLGYSLVLRGLVRRTRLQRTGHLEVMGDVESRLLWRAQWTTLFTLPLNLALLIMALI